MAGKITAIRTAGTNPPRVAVYVDGREAFTVSEEMASELDLAVGAELAPEETERLEEDGERERARDAALRLLAVRARSEHELLTRLARKGIDERVAGEVVASLAEVGLVDDEAFARAWADERARLRPVGPRRLSQELAAKGVSRELAARVVDEAFAEIPELVQARRVASKRARTLKDGDAAKARRRLQSLLVRRGFSYDVAAVVIKELEGEPDV